MALGIFSEDCICTSLCGGALGTFTLRELESFRLVLVVNYTLLWRRVCQLLWLVSFRW